MSAEAVLIPQWVMNLVGLMMTGICGWFLRVLWEAQRDMKEDIREIELKLAEDYMPRTAIEHKLDKLFEKLDRIEDKLDRKVDKIGILPPGA